jgi:hypothetical protein
MSPSLLAHVTARLDGARIPCALIGASALAVHGVSRSTLDQDLLVVDRRALDPETWAGLPSPIRVDVRRGDDDDPLAGIIRFTADGQRDVDVVVGRSRWEAEILERAVFSATPDGEVRVVSAPDLVLLKLYAGGPQDLWDIEQLRASAGIEMLEADVEQRLAALPARCRDAWSRLTGRQ